MDFLLELLVQLVVQVLVEVVGELLLEGALHGVVGLAQSRRGRRVMGAAVGLVAGSLWGQHLSGGAHVPKLLWVSLSLGATAAALAVNRPGTPRESESRPALREVLQPPWRWSARRLVDFVLLNAGIAAGVLLGFRSAEPADPPRTGHDLRPNAVRYGRLLDEEAPCARSRSPSSADRRSCSSPSCPTRRQRTVSRWSR